ncbi:MAG: hypothetical protein V4669_18975 [Pseudomonadota bacterium]
MADLSALEVLDTAVKVGLGALISGLTTYWVTARKSRDDLARERSLRGQQMLVGVSEQVEALSHQVFRYWAIMAELVRSARQGLPIPEHRQQDLDKTKAAMFDAYGPLTSAEAKLLLLGHREAAQSLREFGEVIREFRRRVYEPNPRITEDQLEEDRAKLLGARELAFEKLSAAYRET